MKSFNAVKIFFYLAVLLFVAKPFMGFSIVGNMHHLNQTHNILVKIFSQRKPEDFDDAKITAAGIQQKLTNPPLLLSIVALLGLVFPAVYKRVGGINYSFLNNLQAELVPAYQPYFLSGKLTI